MLPRTADPIVAIATAPGRGAVGIVRVSGQGLQTWAEGLLGRSLQPRQAHYLPFTEADGRVIDQGLAIFFPAPHSYTGEDVLELQAHGGPVVLQLLQARCLQAGAERGLRLAEPGEFTQRAFLNDKIDLAQAEAVADLIDAATEAAARSASRSLSGAFSQAIGVLREELVALRVLVEATLDFPEEEIDFLQQADARGRLDRIDAQLTAVREQAREGALLREGLTVVLAGQPNVGKSSLLNALAGAELAIVTPLAGTTRDKVRETVQIHGVPVHVIDTAGLREAGDEVERIGVARSWDAIATADAVLVLHDLSRRGERDYELAQAVIEARLTQTLLAGVPTLHVGNKIDLAPQALRPGELGVGAREGLGLEVLREHLFTLARGHAEQTGLEGGAVARARHVDALRRAAEPLAQARRQISAPQPALDLLAEDLRAAHQALGEITGAYGTEDLLGDIFGRFCIGK